MRWEGDFDSEQGELIISNGCAGGAARFEEAMGGDEEIEVAGVALHARSEAGGGEELVESVSDVFEFGVEFLAMAVEPVLEAFEEVGRKVSTI